MQLLTIGIVSHTYVKKFGLGSKISRLTSHGRCSAASRMEKQHEHEDSTQTTVT